MARFQSRFNLMEAIFSRRKTQQEYREGIRFQELFYSQLEHNAGIYSSIKFSFLSQGRVCSENINLLKWCCHNTNWLSAK